MLSRVPFLKAAPVAGSYIEIWKKQPDRTWQILRKV